MGEVVGLSFTAAFNPTLLAATTVMLLLPHPARLMLGYYLGAMLTSITLGLVIVFSIPNSSTTNTTENTLSPVADIVIGAIMLVLALVLATGRDEPIQERRAKRREAKKDTQPPRWQRAMSNGSPRTTFVIGALLTLPGASYLAGLDKLSKLNYSTTVTVLVVIGFNLVMLILLEAPIVAFAVAPEWTPDAIDRGKAWVSRHARKFAVYGLTGVGVTLVGKGIVGLL
jgi:Sap, sulfolipid-1-addressing protein